jgi:hypothetical protein
MSVKRVCVLLSGIFILLSQPPCQYGKYWHCKHCTETQFAEANGYNKETHLKRHGISKHGRKTPNMRFNPTTRPVDQTPPIRQSESYVNLTTAVTLGPFKNALVAFVVICQVALSLVINEVFIEFLEIIYPSIRNLLPLASNTIRGWIMESFEARKGRLKQRLAKSNSMIHFSFDLWTSPNHLALLGIVVHFIDEIGQNQSVS